MSAFGLLDFLAQTTPHQSTGGGLWSLFRQSFDLFTILLLVGSLVGVALIFLCFFEVREASIAPPAVCSRLRGTAASGRIDEVREIVQRDDSFVSRVVRAALSHVNGERTAMREAAELAASEETARWFRKIDLLNVIGNLGPLVGLAGTVWGMILAFTSLGESGGTAGPADLSLGISKALFHTLLGLCLAIPCLLAYSVFRGRIDKMCTRGIVVASEVVELLPAGAAGHVKAESGARPSTAPPVHAHAGA